MPSIVFNRKFQPKTDAKFAYDMADEDDEKETPHVPTESQAELSGPSSEKVQSKEMQAAKNSRKFRNKLNL